MNNTSSPFQTSTKHELTVSHAFNSATHSDVNALLSASSSTQQLAPPTKNNTTLASLPTELLLRIFTLSSNPSLAIISRDFHARLGSASKTSVATRVEFLSIRYRNKWAKMVVKGLRWRFFDLDVLHALDRLYARSVEKKQGRKKEKKERKKALKELQHQQEGSLLQILLSASQDNSSSSGGDTQDSSSKRKLSPLKMDQDVSAATSSSSSAQGEEEEESRRKRLRTVGAEAYWRSSTSRPSPYSFFSSEDPPATLISQPRSIYSYPALASKPEMDPSLSGAPLASSRNGTIAKGELPDEEERDGELDIKIPLPPNFQIPRRLFRSASSMSSTPSTNNKEGIQSSNNHHNIALVRELLQRGGSATAPANYPMIRSAQRGDLTMIRTLVKYGGAVPDQTALRWACIENHMEVVDYFLPRGGYETEEIQVAEMVSEEGEEDGAQEGKWPTKEKESARTTRKIRLRHGLVPNSDCLQACLERGNTRMVDRLLKSGAVPDMKTLMKL